MPTLMVTVLVLSAASGAEQAACKAALAKVKGPEWEQRQAAFEACAPLFSDEMKGTWLASLNVSPPMAASILAAAANEEVPGLVPAKNVCLRTKSRADLGICAADPEGVRRLSAAEVHRQWRTLFGRILVHELGAKAAAPLDRAFGEKWAFLFPAPPPPEPEAPASNLTIMGTVDREPVEKALAEVEPEVRKCLPNKGDAFSLKLVVSASGKVATVSVLSPADAPRGCVLKALEKAPFPQPRGGGVAIIGWGRPAAP